MVYVIILLRISNYYGGVYMNLRKIFAQTTNVPLEVSTTSIPDNIPEIICDTVEITELITNWIESEGWSFKDFATLIKLIGIKTPVKLTNLNKDNNSFQCISALNTCFFIELRFVYSDILVTEGTTCKCYSIHRNFPSFNNVISFSIRDEIIIKNDKKLIITHAFNNCKRTLQLDNSHKLQVYIYGSTEIISKNYQKFDDYLFTLNNSPMVYQVYHQLIKTLELSYEQICNIGKLSICYIETINGNAKIRSIITVSYGTIYEYAIFDGDETFHVWKDGNWEYSDKNTSIFCSKKSDGEFSMSITGNNLNIINSYLLRRVKQKISQLMEFVK